MSRGTSLSPSYSQKEKMSREEKGRCAEKETVLCEAWGQRGKWLRRLETLPSAKKRLGFDLPGRRWLSKANSRLGGKRRCGKNTPGERELTKGGYWKIKALPCARWPLWGPETRMFQKKPKEGLVGKVEKNAGYQN